MPWPSDGYSNFSPIVVGSQNIYPNSTIGQFIKNGGTWVPTINRLRAMVQYSGLNRPAPSGGETTTDIGTYTFFGTDPSDLAHMYHSIGCQVVNNAWTQIEWTGTFDHVVGASAPYYYQNQAFENVGWLNSPAWRDRESVV